MRRLMIVTRPHFFNAARNMFLVSLEYKKPLDEVDKHLQAHREFLDKCYEQRLFILSGRKEPRTGGIIIASIESKEKLLTLLNNDPFKQNDVADYQITEFFPTMGNKELSNIIEVTR